MHLKHLGWSVVINSPIPKLNFWRGHCTQMSESGPLGLLFVKLVRPKVGGLQHVTIP